MKKINLSQPIRYAINIALILLLLAGVVFLNFNLQNKTQTENEQVSKVSQKLNVAVVNEDKSVESGGEIYNLGSSYIKSIERDDKHNWVVVSRSIAEAGLKNGDYQLVVYIPSDFSNKILDINNVNVEKTTVTYKVNANGNLQVENLANQLGKDIISDLNTQLVDMYMVSIMSNLYSAQQNVQKIADTQTTNIASYKKNLYDTAISFQDLFPNLVSTSESSLQANNSLMESLMSVTSLHQAVDTAQTEFNTSLEELVARHSSGDLSYEELTAAILSMNTQVLNAETSSLFEGLQSQQATLVSELESITGTTTTDENGLVTSATGVAQISAQIEALEASLQIEKDKLQAQIDAVAADAETLLDTYFARTTTGEAISLREFLNADATASTTSGSSTYETLLAQMVNESATDLVEKSAEELPAAKVSDIQSFLQFSGTDYSTAITEYDSAVETIVASNAGSIKFNEKLFKALQDAQADLAKLQPDYENSLKSITPAGEDTTLTVSDVDDSSTVWSVDITTADGKTTTETHKSGDSVSIPAGATYNITTTVSTGAATPATGTGATPPAITDHTLKVVQTTLAGTGKATFNYENYILALTNYNTLVQRVISAYNHVGTLAAEAYNHDTVLATKILDMDVRSALKTLVASALANNLTSYQTALANDSTLAKQLQDLKDSKDSIATQLANVQTTNTSISEQIKEQLALLESLKTQANTITDAQAKSDTSQSETTSGLTALSSQLQSLVSASDSVKASSEANSTEANSVNQIFTNFNSQVESAQQRGQNLSAEASVLMGQFEAELNESGDFASSFASVLNNAYSNGVPNEVLLDFLSNPVLQKTSSIKATTNVYRPFTWILLLEVVTLFTAYLFATQDLAKRVKNQFKLDKLYHTDFLNVALLSALALLIGVVIGLVSYHQLMVESEYVPIWVLLVVLFSFLLTQGQYFLLKNLRALGMGLILFMIISFVYLSNAIGTTVNLSGSTATLKSLNLLSVLENQLSGYFDGRTASLLFVLLTIAGIIALSVLNTLFTWPSGQKASHTQEGLS
ncbi:type VII secretion protein EsaA [Streptococcus caprae]|uniref:Type VII secretion system accessory factor EsaA n=1 Tax=Streptococcus caprae TaxID=1640501 RepID=A0ABV8CW78_9STRE